MSKNRKTKILILITCTIIFLMYYEARTNEGLRIGKNIYFEVTSETTADWKALTEEGNYYHDKFSIIRKDSYKKIVKYMKKNDLKIAPGIYKINQAWAFKDGVFINTRYTENGTESYEIKALDFIE